MVGDFIVSKSITWDPAAVIQEFDSSMGDFRMGEKYLGSENETLKF